MKLYEEFNNYFTIHFAVFSLSHVTLELLWKLIYETVDRCLTVVSCIANAKPKLFSYIILNVWKFPSIMDL